jgi:hypothetical protein
VEEGAGDGLMAASGPIYTRAPDDAAATRCPKAPTLRTAQRMTPMLAAAAAAAAAAPAPADGGVEAPPREWQHSAARRARAVAPRGASARSPAAPPPFAPGLRVGHS